MQAYEIVRISAEYTSMRFWQSKVNIELDNALISTKS